MREKSRVWTVTRLGNYLRSSVLSWNLKDKWGATSVCLKVILASPFPTGHTHTWTISFADDCQGWEECVSTASATLWLPCQNPTEAAAGQWRQEQDQDSISTSEKKKKVLFVIYWPVSLFRCEKLSPLVNLTSSFGVVWPVDQALKMGCGGWKDGQRTTLKQNSQSASLAGRLRPRS